MEYEKHFIPLESDPAIFTSLMHDLGVPKSFKFIDIWSLDADQLHNIRSETQIPIEALVLILPDCPAYTEQTVEYSIPKGDILWLQQNINNACGLYAILHCVCNILATKEIDLGSFMDSFMKEPAVNHARYLQNSPELETIYHKAALSGSTEPPAAEDEVEYHYICLVRRSGCLYELDGDRAGQYIDTTWQMMRTFFQRRGVMF